MPRKPKRGSLLVFYEMIFNPKNPESYPKNREELLRSVDLVFKEVLKKFPGYTKNKFYNALYTWATNNNFWKDEYESKTAAAILRENTEVLDKFRELWVNGADLKTIIQEIKVNNKPVFRGKSDIHNAVRDLGLPRRRELKKIKHKEELNKSEESTPSPLLEENIWKDPPVFRVTKEAWERPGVRIGAYSRIDWKEKGSRADLVRKAYEKVFVPLGCHYCVLDGGLVSKKYVESRIKQSLAGYTVKELKLYKEDIVKNVLEQIALELNSIIPIVEKPDSDKKGSNDNKYVRTYIMTSRILDGPYGETIAKFLQGKRGDIRVYKQGGDRTRLKGVYKNKKEKDAGGQEIGWLNPKKHRLPSQYVSTAVDKEIREEESAAESYPEMWGVAGFSSAMSKPGGGEKKRAMFSLPGLSVPIPREEGEPSIALNQIGVRVIEADLDGEGKRIQNWSFRDLVKDERSFITGIKSGAKPIHVQIVNEIKKTRKGLHVGELADAICGVTREEIEKEIQFLVEPKSLNRTTWPGLYKDDESGRYNFHLDWFQERLQYPWPYDKNFNELRRLIFGCLHAGYNTTDYEYVRYKFPEIILKLKIKVLELVGDITAGLKHHLIHRGQIIGSLNYTEQEIFAGELLATVIYEVFAQRFGEFIVASGELKNLKLEDIRGAVADCILLFIFIVGNHEAWQKEFGHTPGVVFKFTLRSILYDNISKFLLDKGVFIPDLGEIIGGKIVELPEYKAIYTFEGGLCAELLHPSMSRTKTISVRIEEALDYSGCQLVDTANYHTTVKVEKWQPDVGQRSGTQAGAMTPITYFEHGKLKRVDFGPVYTRELYKDGRIFMSEHQFFNKPILREPIDKDTNVKHLKERLKVLRMNL